MVVTARSPLHLLVNFVAFEIGWFAAVLGAAHQRVWQGVAVAMLVVLLHLLMSHRVLRELQLLFCVMVIGAVWDSALAATHIIQYPSGQVLPATAPVWIIAVWALFATTLNVSMVFLRGRPLLAAFIGIVGAPLSFLGGMHLNALQFPDTNKALLALAIGWALWMPLMIYLAKRFDGVSVVDERLTAVEVMS